MRKFITVILILALSAGSAAPPVLAGGGHRHHGSGYGQSHYGGYYYKHRKSDRHRHRRHGGSTHFSGDGAVILGILAGAVVLGALLSRPDPAPPRPPVLRSPTGAPLGGCVETTGQGFWNGRQALFSGTMCYDTAGRPYVLPGSKRFVGYLR
jgi:hypothetical protein